MSDLSIEQAALREALPAPWPDVLDALQSIVGVNDSLFGLVKLIQERHDSVLDDLGTQAAEQGDAILALSNRIETLTRTVTLHHGQLAQVLGHSPLDGVS